MVSGVRRFAMIGSVGLLLALGCTDDSDPESSAAPAATTDLTAPAPVTELETYTVIAGPPEPVPVPGEPDVESRDYTSGTGEVGSKGEFVISVPDSWTEPRGQGVLCRWTEPIGLHRCTDLNIARTSGGIIHMPGNTEPGEPVEIWLRSDFTGLQRRLYAGPSPPQFVFHELATAPGYETLDDILSQQPPSDGNYLVASEWTP